MRIAKPILSLAFLAAAALLASCGGQQVNTPHMVNPKIVRITQGGKMATVNIGFQNDVRSGDKLYVMRGGKFIGILLVETPLPFESECVVMTDEKNAIKGTSDKVAISKVAVGDLVSRSVTGIGYPGNPTERVSKYVPVPYDAENHTIDRDGKPVKIETAVPREEYEKWKKEHPPKSTGAGALKPQ
jgi:hypothetical protein